MSTNDDDAPGLAGLLIIFALVLYAFWEHYPTIACFIITGTLALFTSDSKSPWLKAANSMLLPASLGFSLLSLLQLFFNWFLDVDAVPGADTPIAATEYTLLAVAKALPAWAKLGWLPAVLILLALIPLSAVLIRLRPVTRWLWAQKILGRLIGALAVATTFSFFTGDDVNGKYVENAKTHVTLVYNASRERELQHLARIISARSIAQTVASLPPDGLAYVTQLLETSASFSPLSKNSLNTLAYLLANAHSPDKRKNLDADWERKTVLASAAPVQGLLSDPERAIETQLMMESIAAQAAAKERTRAIEEILSITLALPTDSAKEVARLFFSQMIEIQEGFLGKQAAAYLGKVTDKYFDKLTEPLVKNTAKAIQQAIYPASSTVSEATKAATLNSKGALRFLTITYPRILVKSGLSVLYPSSHFSSLELTQARIRAANYFHEAEAVVNDFGPAYLHATSTHQRNSAQQEVDKIRSTIADAKISGGPSQARLQEMNKHLERIETEQKARLRGPGRGR